MIKKIIDVSLEKIEKNCGLELVCERCWREVECGNRLE